MERHHPNGGRHAGNLRRPQLPRPAACPDKKEALELEHPGLSLEVARQPQRRGDECSSNREEMTGVMLHSLGRESTRMDTNQADSSFGRGCPTLSTVLLSSLRIFGKGGTRHRQELHVEYPTLCSANGRALERMNTNRPHFPFVFIRANSRLALVLLMIMAAPGCRSHVMQVNPIDPTAPPVSKLIA